MGLFGRVRASFGLIIKSALYNAKASFGLNIKLAIYCVKCNKMWISGLLFALSGSVHLAKRSFSLSFPCFAPI